MFPIIFRTTIFLFLFFTCLTESSALSSQESIFRQQSKKTVFLARNTNTPPQQASSTKRTAQRGRRGSMSVRKSDPIKAQYENCKGKDIYKLNSQFQDKASLKETEASGPCMDCFIDSHFETGSLGEIAQTIEEAKSSTQTKMEGRVRGVTNRGNKRARGSHGSRVAQIKSSPYKSFKDQLRKRVLGQV
ncbi:MAG: hypothetical protein OXM55_04825, partial [Bdellovibrionales bacterium]|nr:hypothetical protein [Bdellovibrionales bacterium]